MEGLARPFMLTPISSLSPLRSLVPTYTLTLELLEMPTILVRGWPNMCDIREVAMAGSRS